MYCEVLLSIQVSTVFNNFTEKDYLKERSTHTLITIKKLFQFDFARNTCRISSSSFTYQIWYVQTDIFSSVHICMKIKLEIEQHNL